MPLLRQIISVAAVLGLAACSSTTGEPISGDPSTTQASPETSTAPVSTTPLSTPPASEPETGTQDAAPTVTPSTDEAERQAAVVPAFEEYWDVINETYAAGGAPEATPRMKETMADAQLDYWEKHFADWAERDRQYEGENRVVYANPTTVVIGADSGNAEVEFCVDMSETRSFEANGDPLTKEGDHQAGVAGLSWVEGNWKVVGFTPETGYVASC